MPLKIGNFVFNDTGPIEELQTSKKNLNHMNPCFEATKGVHDWILLYVSEV